MERRRWPAWITIFCEVLSSRPILMELSYFHGPDSDGLNVNGTKFQSGNPEMMWRGLGWLACPHTNHCYCTHIKFRLFNTSLWLLHWMRSSYSYGKFEIDTKNWHIYKLKQEQELCFFVPVQMLMFDVYPHTLCLVSLIFLHVTLHFLLTHHHLCQKLNCPETGFCWADICSFFTHYTDDVNVGQNDNSEYFFSVSFHSPFTGASIHTTFPFPIHCTLSILSPVNISTHTHTHLISTVDMILI